MEIRLATNWLQRIDWIRFAWFAPQAIARADRLRRAHSV